MTVTTVIVGLLYETHILAYGQRGGPSRPRGGIWYAFRFIIVTVGYNRSYIWLSCQRASEGER